MAKERLFLYQVYRHHKRLFWGMVFFADCTLLTNLSGDEMTPFFVWGMYSEKAIKICSVTCGERRDIAPSRILHPFRCIFFELLILTFTLIFMPRVSHKRIH